MLDSYSELALAVIVLLGAVAFLAERPPASPTKGPVFLPTTRPRPGVVLPPSRPGVVLPPVQPAQSEPQVVGSAVVRPVDPASVRQIHVDARTNRKQAVAAQHGTRIHILLPPERDGRWTVASAPPGMRVLQAARHGFETQAAIVLAFEHGHGGTVRLVQHALGRSVPPQSIDRIEIVVGHIL